MSTPAASPERALELQWGAIRVQLHPSALLILGVMILLSSGEGDGGLNDGLARGVAFLISVLVHEMGHALMGQRLGLGPSTVLIHGFGGYTRYRRAPQDVRSGLLSSGAGPGAGLLLAGLCILLVRIGLGGLLLDYLLLFNLFWSLFNLLPTLPLDGGHLLLYALRGLRPERAESWAVHASLVTSVLLLLITLWLQQLFLGLLSLYLLSLNLKSRKRLRLP